MSIIAVTATNSFGSVTIPSRTTTAPKQTAITNIKVAKDDVVSLSIPNGDRGVEEKEVNKKEFAENTTISPRPFLSVTSKSIAKHNYLFILK